MKIGFTYDLRQDYLKMGFTDEQTAEFDSDETITAIEAELTAMGHEVERIGNIYALTGQLAQGKRWDMVFNIAEGMSGPSRESQVPALLDAYSIPYTFSSAVTLALCLDKALTKKLVAQEGLRTPAFAVVHSRNDVRISPLPDNVPFPLFVKPLTEGTSKGIGINSVVRDINALRLQCSRLLELFEQPVLVESYLPGREFTVGILGTGSSARCIGSAEIILGHNAEPMIYSYLNKEFYEDRVSYVPVEDKRTSREAETLALRIYRLFGCRDAGRVDLKADEDGNLHFLEINPLAGLNPVRSDLAILCRLHGLSYSHLMSGIVESALERVRSKSAGKSIRERYPIYMK